MKAFDEQMRNTEIDVFSRIESRAMPWDRYDVIDSTPSALRLEKTILGTTAGDYRYQI